MPPTVYLPTRRRLVLLAAGSLGMALASVAVMLTSSVKALIVGPIGVFFFGGAAVFYALRLASRGPELTVTDEGFTHRTWGRVEWGEVEVVVFRSIRVRGAVQKVIEVVLHDPEAVIARRPRAARVLAASNRRFGFAPVCIATTVLPASTEEVLYTMQGHHQRFLDAA